MELPYHYFRFNCFGRRVTAGYVCVWRETVASLVEHSCTMWVGEHVPLKQNQLLFRRAYAGWRNKPMGILRNSIRTNTDSCIQQGITSCNNTGYGLTSWGATLHVLGGEHCWTQAFQEVSGIARDNLCMEKPTEKMVCFVCCSRVENKWWGKWKLHGSMQVPKWCEEGKQQHYHPAVHESILQLVQGTDRRIAWEAAYQGKRLWESWLVFQDRLLKPKNGPFQFTGKRASAAGGWPACSRNFWLSPNKRKCMEGENGDKQSRQNTEEQRAERIRKAKTLPEIETVSVSIWRAPFYWQILLWGFPESCGQGRAWEGGRESSIIHSRGRLR